MITYYLFGNFCGPFRTKDVTETPEQFAEWCKKYDAHREGCKIIDDKGKHFGNITEDTTGGEVNPRGDVGVSITIKQS